MSLRTCFKKRALGYLQIAALLLASNVAWAIRLKDLAALRGARDNSLVGYGLVVGLPGSGDRANDFTENSLMIALRGLGIDPKSQKLGTRNSAAVLVSAVLPPFARAGSHIDVTVSSVGSATSLEGGSLVLTPLKGADNKVYAIAQGRIEIPKRNEKGNLTRAPQLTSYIPAGALIERSVAFDFSDQKELRYQLYQADFTTSARIAHRINEELGGKFATATDAGTVDVILPYGTEENAVDWVARLEAIDVEPDHRAKIVINRRTGMVVLGDNIRIFPVSIAHNNLRILVRDETRNPNEAPPEPSPEPTPQGNAVGPVEIPNPTAQAKKPRKETYSNRGTSIADMVLSLNEIGANPDDLLFLLQALRSSGALVAELEMQ